MSEWVSVKDRMPENDNDVLGYDGEFIAMVQRVGNSLYPVDLATHFDQEFTHWMPLPNPPLEDK